MARLSLLEQDELVRQGAWLRAGKYYGAENPDKHELEEQGARVELQAERAQGSLVRRAGTKPGARQGPGNNSHGQTRAEGSGAR